MSGVHRELTALGDVDHVTFANIEQHDQQVRVCPDWTTENINCRGLIGLTKGMHPAFEESKFAGQGFNLEDTHQARLFASRLLEADCSMPFWWALMSGTSVGDWELEDREAKAANIRTRTLHEAKAPQSETDDTFLRIKQARTPDCELRLLDPPEALTRDQITKTKADLRELATYISYKVGEDAKGSRCGTSWPLRAAPHFRGSPSRIVISAEELRTHSADMEGDLVCQAGASVSLGFRLLQLLAHAAVGAVRSGPECNWNTNYFFLVDGNVGAEIRMLECWTFGGLIRREQEQEQVAKSHYTINGAEGVPGLWFAFSDWAGVDVFDMIGEIGADEKEALYQEDHGPFYHREWQVSFLWLLGLLTDNFWDNEVPRRGQAALKPPLEVGYVMCRDDERKYGPLHSEDIRHNVVPDGYSMLPRSYVMVSDQLLHQGRQAMLFGGFGLERMVIPPSDDELDVDYGEAPELEGNGSESSEPDMAEAAPDVESDNDSYTGSDVNVEISSEFGIEMDND